MAQLDEESVFLRSKLKHGGSKVRFIAMQPSMAICLTVQDDYGQTQARCTPIIRVVYHQVPSFRATSAKLDPTVLLALLLIHLPACLPSTSYFVLKGISFIPLVRKVWVVLMTAACTAVEEAEAATIFQSELKLLASSFLKGGGFDRSTYRPQVSLLPV